MESAYEVDTQVRPAASPPVPAPASDPHAWTCALRAATQPAVHRAHSTPEPAFVATLPCIPLSLWMFIRGYDWAAGFGMSVLIVVASWLRPLPHIKGPAACGDLAALNAQADLLAPHPHERLQAARPQR